MNSSAKLQPLDDIETFLPGISAEEYALRAKLRSYRNAATAMIHNTASDTARCLAWLTIDYVIWSMTAT